MKHITIYFLLVSIGAVSLGLIGSGCFSETNPQKYLSDGRKSIWVERVFVEVEGGFVKLYNDDLLTVRAISPELTIRLTLREHSHSQTLNLKLENFGDTRNIRITKDKGAATELILPPDGRISLEVEVGQSLTLSPFTKPSQEQERLSFAVLSDNRVNYEVLTKMVSKINDMANEIDFVIHLGDSTNKGTWEEIDKFAEVMRPLRPPLYMVIGNHEVWDHSQGKRRTDMGRAKFTDFWGPLYHAFAYKGSYFIFLDNASRIIEEDQFRWLKERLSESQSYGHRFIFGHVPPFDPRLGRNAQMDEPYGSQLTNLLSEYGVEAAFFSHIHTFLQAQRDGVSYYITGGAGAHLAKGGFYHFLRVVVSKEGVQVKAIEIKG